MARSTVSRYRTDERDPGSFPFKHVTYPMGGEGVRGRALTAPCLDRLTDDHASLSSWSTASTTYRDTLNVWALMTFLVYNTRTQKTLYTSHPLPVVVCGHHLSPSTAIFFSLLFHVPNDLMSPSFTSYVSPLIRPVLLCIVQIPLLYEFYHNSLLQGILCAFTSSSTHRLV